MKIMRVHALGGPENLTLDDIDPPIPAAGQLRLKVLACGVNFADGLLIAGKYQAKPELPFGPGSEVCGVIQEIGPGVQGFKVGERVIALTGGNGFAEEVVVTSQAAFPVPDAMPCEVAAAFPIAYGTSHMALWQKARLQPGETLVVHGASGGVGLTAVEIGKAMGARVIATASSPEKLEIARSRGADELINSSEEDVRLRIKALTEGKGADVIYDPVGGAMFDASLRAINFNGRILVVGFASGTIPQIPANIVMVKNIDILGINWPNYRTHAPELLKASFEQLARWYADGLIKPLVSKVFPLSETRAAIEHVQARKAKGKVVVVPN
ncbi:MAG: NADPH:quinone oxidoreductase family protein [Alphaproteobacteria bacterium]|nr:MAG: NADPH:quinone oxidoreductase family protein [Alphaproteobacteria bacterium]